MYQFSPTIFNWIFPFVSREMVRNSVRKTNRGKMLKNIFQKACVGVEKESMSLCQSARIYGIDKIALLRYINKKKQASRVKVGYSRHPSFTH